MLDSASGVRPFFFGKIKKHKSKPYHPHVPYSDKQQVRRNSVNQTGPCGSALLT